MAYIYQFFLFLGFIFYLPCLVLRKKGGPTLKERLGILSKVPRKTKSRLVWIHAVSLGEAKAAAPLAKMMKEAYGGDAEFVISFGTASGREAAEKSIPFADFYLYLPLDFIWIMKNLVKGARPDLVIICETDLWYNFLNQCKQEGAKLILVNGKMSERTFLRYQAFSFWAGKIFPLFYRICVQSYHYAHRFEKLGVQKSVIKITGNLKLDNKEPVFTGSKEEMGLNDRDLVLVIGSTHHPEERWFLEILEGMWDDFPNLKVLLVPRHPERFNEVEELLEQSGLPYRKYTDKDSQPFKIQLVDAMGILKNCYQFADAAIVGGSYVKDVGGHNILEPSEFGVAVVFGPNMQSQPELIELCIAYGAGLQAAIEELPSVLRSLLKNKQKRDILGQNGLRLIQDNRGASRRTFEIIHKSCCL